jgi:hypothetical protein
MNNSARKRFMLTAALLGALAAQSAWACKAPVSPKSIPDGRKAQKEAMLEAKRDVERYVENVSLYLNCENDGLKLQEVVAAQKLVMDRFNSEVRAYNAALRRE